MIKTPTFLIDSKKCKANIQQMADKAKQLNLQFRPHFKTHQSQAVGEWFKEIGVSKITVSSVGMAEYFANSGWRDITIAFPVNILEIEDINKLANNITLNILVESLETVDFLNKNLNAKVNAFVKIDTGYHRTGVAWSNTESLTQIINKIDESSTMSFLGFLTHSGHTYQVKGKDAVNKIHSDTIEKMAVLKVHFYDTHPNIINSIGDTPSCSISDNFMGIDEIRPGNFVYYDAMQLEIGSCTINQIAATVVCPIVAKHQDRNEIVIYGGGVHLSKELGTSKKNGPHYGFIATSEKTNTINLIDNVYVKKLSQEHGIIHCTDSFLKTINIGDLLYVIPVHSCLSANLLKEYTQII